MLIRAGEHIYKRSRGREGFSGFVPSDYHKVLETLKTLQPGSLTELGSGIGVVTIMSDKLGFQATGIEIETQPMEYASLLRDMFDSKASFILGDYHRPISSDYVYIYPDPEGPDATDIVRPLITRPSTLLTFENGRVTVKLVDPR